MYTSTDSTGYKFDLSIAPGGSMDVRFYFMPRQTADAVAQAPTSTTAPFITPEPSSPPPCQAAPTTAALTTAPTTASDWSLLWEDDFSVTEGGFFVGDNPDSAFWYEGNEYRIEVRQVNWLAWTFLGYELNDIQMSIDVRMQNSTGATAYGLLCRQQSEGNFYGFEFSEDGYYTIWLRYNEEDTNTWSNGPSTSAWTAADDHRMRGREPVAHAERRGTGERDRCHPHFRRCRAAGRIR